MWTTCTSFNLAGGFLESTSELFEAIRSALNSNFPNASVKFIEKQSTLVINSKHLEKSLTWKIQLERLETTADTKCAFLVKQMEHFKSRMNYL